MYKTSMLGAVRRRTKSGRAQLAGFGFVDPATVTAVISLASSGWKLFSNPYDPARKTQNEEAFRRAMNGGAYDADFLKGRTGRYGVVSIPVNLPYAISPVSKTPETPGSIGGWATEDAKKHAQTLYARYQDYVANRNPLQTMEDVVKGSVSTVGREAWPALLVAALVVGAGVLAAKRGGRAS
jgi:hypothetical protein